MQSPIFSQAEYIGPSLLSNAFSLVSESALSAIASVFGDGIIGAAGIVLTASGMNLTVTMQYPTGIVLGYNVAFAHGTTNGSDTQSTVVNFAPYVPGSGSLEVYLYATIGTIQQGLVTIPGPPPGHPSFDPNFVATTAYTESQDTIVLAVGTSVPNGIEILRTSLTAGQTTLSVWDTTHQAFAGAQLNVPAGTTSIGSISTDVNGRPTFNVAPTAALLGGTPTALTAVTVGADLIMSSGTLSVDAPNSSLIGGSSGGTLAAIGIDDTLLLSSGTLKGNKQWIETVYTNGASGIYTVAAGIRNLWVRGWGPGGRGGAGGGGFGSGATGGGYFEGTLTVTDGQTFSYVAGAVVLGGTGSDNTITGTATAFGGGFTATAGANGNAGSATGGTGAAPSLTSGIGTGGTDNMNGFPGQAGIYFNAASQGLGGVGGATAYFANPCTSNGAYSGASLGQNGQFPGVGGGGGVGSANGGAGGPGHIIIVAT